MKKEWFCVQSYSGVKFQHPNKLAVLERLNATITKGERGKRALPLSDSHTHSCFFAFVVCVTASLLLLFSIPCFLIFIYFLRASFFFLSLFYQSKDN